MYFINLTIFQVVLAFTSSSFFVFLLAGRFKQLSMLKIDMNHSVEVCVTVERVKPPDHRLAMFRFWAFYWQMGLDMQSNWTSAMPCVWPRDWKLYSQTGPLIVFFIYWRHGQRPIWPHLSFCFLRHLVPQNQHSFRIIFVGHLNLRTKKKKEITI